MASGAVDREFSRRLEQVQPHGLGLSVDVYSPDLASLLRALRQRQVMPGYLEVFRAPSAALSAVRSRAGDVLLTYHGEGLWLTQPEADTDHLFKQEACEVGNHLQILQSAWLNHECATKHIAGYSFGTYLPPLYTESSAQVVADNTVLVQNLVDDHYRLNSGSSPLVLLEMPPLTYFVAGTVSIPTFFRLVAERAPCGLVLDIGHLWTVYRYSAAWKRMSLMQYVDEFLAEFPLNRTVEIHVAGLALHASSDGRHSEANTIGGSILPAWIDAHAAPIPSVLFDMLDQVLSHPGLTGLKGLALEVDTKPVELTVDEFERFCERYATVFSRPAVKAPVSHVRAEARSYREPMSSSVRTALGEEYERYARVVAGRSQPEGPEWDADTAYVEELDHYRADYLPYEILHWGGEVNAMFPETCRGLDERGVNLEQFVSFWFSKPRPLSSSYDFFLLKVERFVEFVHEAAPDLETVAGREADELRQAYHSANEPVVMVAGEST